MLFESLLVILTIQTITVQAHLRHHRNTQLLDVVERLVAVEPSTSNLPTSTASLPSISIDILDVDPTITSITSYASTSSASSSSCTPKSLCVELITCSMRYGGCYDANFCRGSSWPPYPIPTCDSSPANGLTSNNAGGSQQSVEHDVAGEVIVKNLMNARVGA